MIILIIFYFEDDKWINEGVGFLRRLRWMEFDILLLFYLFIEGVSLMLKVEIGFFGRERL